MIGVRTYSSFADCRRAVSARVEIGSLPWQDAILDGLARACECATATERDIGYSIRLGRWAIRDDDLKVFQTLRDAIAAMASVNFFLNAPTPGAITGVVLALAQTALNARRCGCWLTSQQAAVLGVLASAPEPLTSQDVSAILGSVLAPEAEELSDQEVQVLLAELEAMPAKGTVSALVQRLPGNRWKSRCG